MGPPAGPSRGHDCRPRIRKSVRSRGPIPPVARDPVTACRECRAGADASAPSALARFGPDSPQFRVEPGRASPLARSLPIRRHGQQLWRCILKMLRAVIDRFAPQAPGARRRPGRQDRLRQGVQLLDRQDLLDQDRHDVGQRSLRAPRAHRDRRGHYRQGLEESRRQPATWSWFCTARPRPSGPPTRSTAAWAASGYGYRGFGGMGSATTMVSEYKVGTLVVDMFDAKRQEPGVPRHRRGRDLGQAREEREKAREGVDEAVQELPADAQDEVAVPAWFASFPAR